MKRTMLLATGLHRAALLVPERNAAKVARCVL
jgi:hypothetical protein